MASYLPNLVNDLSEGIHIIKCRYEHDDKICEACGIKYKYGDCFLEYVNFKVDLIECNCFCCSKNYQHKFDEKLKERFFNTHKFCNHSSNTFFCSKKVFILMNICMTGKIQ